MIAVSARLKTKRIVKYYQNLNVVETAELYWRKNLYFLIHREHLCLL